METTASAPSEPKKTWFEPATAVLMALATLSTAWCSYQSSRWSGQSNGLGTRADKLQRQVFAQYIESQQIEGIHVQMFMEAMNAQMKGDEKLARFYIDRFSGELKPAYEKWTAMKPFDNPAAPPHPFTPELYVPRFGHEIQSARIEAAEADAQSNTEASTASSYLNNTVLLASVLFFAGTASKFDQRRVRWSSLAFAIAFFLYAAVRILLLPVA